VNTTPDPDQPHPTTRPDLKNVVFLKPTVTSPLIEAGEYSYHDNEGDPTPFEHANVRYLYGPQRLVIGKFTAIAPGTMFLMPAGNHPMIGPSTYPFTMFGGEWTERTLDTFLGIEQPGDTIIGNDVWIGRQAVIMPGVSIGDGAIIGAHSIVTKNVGPYEIVAGNPARVIRTRYSENDVTTLLQASWWNWPTEQITKHAATIMAGTPSDLAELHNPANESPKDHER
jgi:virginiamycin A acetyltransferase